MPGRTSGIKNYKNDKKLLDLVEAHLPTGGFQWQRIAQLYRIAAQEDVERDPSDLKNHFLKKLCNNGQKPTGRRKSTICPATKSLVLYHFHLRNDNAPLLPPVFRHPLLQRWNLMLNSRFVRKLNFRGAFNFQTIDN